MIGKIEETRRLTIPKKIKTKEEKDEKSLNCGFSAKLGSWLCQC